MPVVIETSVRYPTHNGVPALDRPLIQERNILHYECDGGEHLLTVWGPYADPDADADLACATEDASDLIEHLQGYPDNPAVEALIAQLRQSG